MKNNVLWDPVLDAIQEEQCVLCIGPGVFTNKKGEPLEEQLIAFLRERGNLDDDIISYPDGLFFFRKENKRSNVLSGMKRFFRREFPNVDAIYALLLEIPFSLILFLTPDSKYTDLAKSKGVAVKSDYYHTNHLPRFKERPSKTFPVAYSILGSLEESASVILTYDDLFEFITDMAKGDRRSTEMRKYIRDARHFICIGLPFEKWYMQLLLRILEMHTNKELTKYAASYEALDGMTQSLYKDQFDITFVPDQIDVFIHNLYQRCQRDGLLRKGLQGQSSLKDTIMDLTAKNRISEALDKVELYLRESSVVEEEHRAALAKIKRRLNMNEAERNKGTIDIKDYRLEMNEITDRFLKLTSEIL